MESSPLYDAVNKVNAWCTIVHFLLNTMVASIIDSTETEHLYAILEKVLEYDIDMCFARGYNACRAFCRILKNCAENKYVARDYIDFKQSCDDVNEIKGCEKRESTCSVDTILHLLKILQSATEEHQEACARIKMSDGKALGEVTLVFTPKDNTTFGNETRFDGATRTQHLHWYVYSCTKEARDRINGKSYHAMLGIILQEIKQLQERIPDFPREL
tara:strand:- start:367 stop:1014 length:648 start_codon:yes stop_codon:yes gene_type:complete